MQNAAASAQTGTGSALRKLCRRAALKNLQPLAGRALLVGNLRSAGPVRRNHRRLKMRESTIEKYLVKRVKELGGEVRKVSWIGRRGAPDRLVMLPQGPWAIWQTVWVELKAPGKTAEPHQLREHKRMQAMGQRVVVIDSLEGVDALLP